MTDVSPTDVLEVLLHRQDAKLTLGEDAHRQTTDVMSAYDFVMGPKCMGAYPEPSRQLIADMKAVAFGGVVELVPSKALKWYDDGDNCYRPIAIVSPYDKHMRTLLPYNFTVMMSSAQWGGDAKTMDWWNYHLEVGTVSMWDDEAQFLLGDKHYHIDVAYQYNSDIQDVDRGIQFIEHHIRWREECSARRSS